MEVKRKILLIVSVLLLACSIYGAGRAIAQEQTIKLTDVELGSTTGAATVKSLDYSEDTVNSEIVFHQLDDSVSFAVTFQNNDNYDYSLKDIKAISDDQPNIEYSFTGIGDTFSSSSSKSITISASYVELISNISERELSNSASFTFIFERIEGSYSPNTLDSITTHMVLFIISLAGIIIAIRGKKGLNDKSCAILIVVCAAIAGNSTTADGDTQIVLNANFNFDLASLVNISYDYSTNGGQSTTGEDLVLAYGNDVDLSPSATKSGWNFVGWNTDKDAHTALEGLSADEDITVYAIYAKPLTATFNANNNTLDGESDQSCSLYNNDESCIVDVPAILVTAPNEVIGYTKSANDHSADNAFYSETYNLSTNESFYAQSQKPEITRAIHWDANGATLERHYDDPETGNDSTCVISASYNNTEQDASCYVEMPYIDEGDAYYEYTGFSMDP